MEISKDSSAKHYEDNKERLKKRLVKEIKVFLRKKKKKRSDNMVMSDIKIYQKIKNKSWLNIEKNITK